MVSFQKMSQFHDCMCRPSILAYLTPNTQSATEMTKIGKNTFFNMALAISWGIPALDSEKARKWLWNSYLELSVHVAVQLN